MTSVFLVCAVVGSVVLLVQFMLTVLGAAGHSIDLDVPDHDASWFFGVLSFRSLVAAVAFFGLGGLAAEQAGLSPYLCFVTALIPAAIAMVVIAWIMSLLHGLQSEGNVLIERAMGMPGTVYLTIPGHREGAGKVTVTVQNRTMEYPAVTSKEELKTGTPVVVVDLIDSNTVEVAALSAQGSKNDD